MTLNLTRLSKTISHALRHEPWVYELELDNAGWVPVPALLQALSETDPAFAFVTLDDIRGLMAKSDKQRFEVSGSAGSENIRALYGHSVPGKLARTPTLPPAVLFHGTSGAAWVEIQTTGLRPMNRQYVHMSMDVGTAKTVGSRKDKKPLILRIDALAAAAAGVPFYVGNEKVWLADGVPAAFLRLHLHG